MRPCHHLLVRSTPITRRPCEWRLALVGAVSLTCLAVAVTVPGRSTLGRVALTASFTIVLLLLRAVRRGARTCVAVGGPCDGSEVLLAALQRPPPVLDFRAREISRRSARAADLDPDRGHLAYVEAD